MALSTAGFFIDVVRAGVAIYRSDDSEIAEPNPNTLDSDKAAKRALRMSPGSPVD
jgi:hypothetical protein